MRILAGLLLWFLAPELEAQSPLYWALANNDALQAWNLTAQGLPDPWPDAGLTAPGLATRRGNFEALEVLLWRGVPLDAIDDRGQNLLFEAAALGRLDLFNQIMAQGARVDQIDKGGQTLIHAAASAPHPEMLQTLLALGLGALARTSVGVTPLMVACEAGRADIATTLLAWGAVPEDQDYLGRSVRDYALAGGDAETLKVIDAALIPWTIAPVGGVPLP